jgi:hypothetical protein
MTRKHYSDKLFADHQDYRLYHPKICYETAKEAAEALKELKKNNRQMHFQYKTNDILKVYYDSA